MNYAYRIYRRTRWRELFGPFSAKYSNYYVFKPYSRRYVTHLQDNYAQAHPDEDFAETFAVWLTPGSKWRERYGDWPVIKKLRYVDAFMKKIGGRPASIGVSGTPWAASRMTSTLGAHYQRKREHLGDEFPGYYDESLRRLFASRPTGSTPCRASVVLRRHRSQMINSVATWTGQRKFDVHELVKKLIRRCDALGLYLSTPEIQTIINTTALVTAVANKTLRLTPGKEHK